MGALARIKASSEMTDGRVAVIEQLAPQGVGSPLHVHHREDEWFYVSEGALTFWVGGELIEAPAGSFVYGPRDIPHTFLVSSAEARYLLVSEPAGFENFMRAVGQPASTHTIPPPAARPPIPHHSSLPQRNAASTSSGHPASPPETRLIGDAAPTADEAIKANCRRLEQVEID